MFPRNLVKAITTGTKIGQSVQSSARAQSFSTFEHAKVVKSNVLKYLEKAEVVNVSSDEGNRYLNYAAGSFCGYMWNPRINKTPMSIANLRTEIRDDFKAQATDQIKNDAVIQEFDAKVDELLYFGAFSGKG